MVMSDDSPPERPFLSGVVEGFYGRPWTNEQRRLLFRWMEEMGLAVYMYAPKDDMKHRARWREPYTDAELAALRQTVRDAAERHVTFVYALSPGLTVAYSRQEDRKALMAKFEQIAGLGCTGFALLFDDINPELSEEDQTAFASEGRAQADLTSDVFRRLGSPQPFLFCPTEYCSMRARPSVAASAYLQDVGAHLAPGIDVLWTGPLVLSRFVNPAELAQQLSPVLRRAPVLWDNLHNNDYDMRRLHMGPLDGRPVTLRAERHLRGLLANPNVQLEANFVPLHSLGQWCRASADADYCRDAAHARALTDWLRELYPDRTADAIPEKERLTLEDLQFIVDFFFLPYEYGANAKRFLECTRWLCANSHLRQTPTFAAHEDFIRHCQAQWKTLCSKLTHLPCREIAYILEPYTAEARFVCGAVLRYLTCLKSCGRPCYCFRFEAREAWDLRGGWLSEVENLLPDIRLEPVPPTAQLPDPAVYLIRAPLPSDQEEVARICDPDALKESLDGATAIHPIDALGLALRRHSRAVASSCEQGAVFLLEAGGPIEGLVQAFPDCHAVFAALPEMSESEETMARIKEIIAPLRDRKAEPGDATDAAMETSSQDGQEAPGPGLLTARLLAECPQGAAARLAASAADLLRRRGCPGALLLAPNCAARPAPDPGPAEPPEGPQGAGEPSSLGEPRPSPPRDAGTWREVSALEAGALLSMDVLARGQLFALCGRGLGVDGDR